MKTSRPSGRFWFGYWNGLPLQHRENRSAFSFVPLNKEVIALAYELNREEGTAHGVRFSIAEDGAEVARVYLYVLRNDLHEKPFGFIEDVFVAEEHRGRGYGHRLVQELIAEAKRTGCYKIIATSRFSRPKVHQLYERFGFKKHGYEFRLDLS